MKKILFLFAFLCQFAASAQLIEFSSIEIRATPDSVAAPYDFSSKFRFDTLTAVLYAWDNGDWVRVADTDLATRRAAISALQTLSGVAPGSTNLGTFTGTIIPPSQTVKDALQALETAVDALPTGSGAANTWNMPITYNGYSATSKMVYLTINSTITPTLFNPASTALNHADIQAFCNNSTSGLIKIAAPSGYTIAGADTVSVAVSECLWLQVDSVNSVFRKVIEPSAGSAGGATVVSYPNPSDAGQETFLVNGTPTTDTIGDIIAGRLIPLSRNYKLRDTVETPAGFPFSPGFEIYRGADGKFTTSIDEISAFRGAYLKGGLTYYVDPIAGNDANAGTSAAAPLQNFATAAGKAGRRVIMLKGAVYNLTSLAFLDAIDSLAIIGYGGRPVLGEFPAITWTAATIPGAYRATAVASTNVLNPNELGEMGEMLHYPLVADSSLLATRWGYTLQGGFLYVRTSDGAPPGVQNVLVVEKTSTVGASQTYRYFECVDMYGSVILTNTFARDMGSFWLFENRVRLGASISVLYDFRFGHSDNDAIDYDEGARGIEVNCVGRDAGLIVSSQLSTAHDTSHVITINPNYQDANDEIIYDVTGSQRWVLGGVLSARVTNFNFAIGTSTKMWIEGLRVTGGHLYTFGGAGTDGIIHLRNMEINSNTRIHATGSRLLKRY